MTAGIGLDQAQAKLAAWLEAEDKVMAGQSYSITTATGSRALTRANLKEIREAIAYWEGKVQRLSPRRGPSRMVPR